MANGRPLANSELYGLLYSRDHTRLRVEKSPVLKTITKSTNSCACLMIRKKKPEPRRAIWIKSEETEENDKNDETHETEDSGDDQKSLF